MHCWYNHGSDLLRFMVIKASRPAGKTRLFRPGSVDNPCRRPGTGLDHGRALHNLVPVYAFYVKGVPGAGRRAEL